MKEVLKMDKSMVAKEPFTLVHIWFMAILRMASWMVNAIKSKKEMTIKVRWSLKAS